MDVTIHRHKTSWQIHLTPTDDLEKELMKILQKGHVVEFTDPPDITIEIKQRNGTIHRIEESV